MEKIDIIDLRQFHSNSQKNEFYFNSLQQHILDNKSLITKPHKHNSYLYILFTNGTGIHEIDFNQFEVSAGSCFMIAPGKIHHWNLSDDVEGFIFTHPEDFYDLHYSNNRIRQFPFFKSVHHLPFIKLNAHAMTEVLLLLQQLQKEQNLENPFKIEKTISLVDLIYIETARNYIEKNSVTTVKSNNYSEKFQQLEMLIEKYFITEKSPSKYAKWMHITPKHLNRITKSVIGKTTSNVILERILLESKRLMLHKNQSFSQIANDLGYEDYAYFSRVFKSKFGLTPSEFLKLYQTL